jgi:transcriptional regulator with XRE-family HTH domain
MFTGEEIRKKRKQSGLSVEELADLLKVNKDNLYKWEKGIKPSRPEDYLAIENWLNKILENVPRETGNRSNSNSEPLEVYKDKYITLLEQTLKEKQETTRGLELHLNVTEEKQKEFLNKLEHLLLELCEVLVPVTEASEVEVVKGHKKSAVKKRTS